LVEQGGRNEWDGLTDNKNSMKKIILSVAMIAAVAAIAIGATTAYFSDTETSTGNTFTAGAIDLKVDSQCSYNGSATNCVGNWGQDENSGGLDITSQKFFSFDDVKPGDQGENTISLHVNNNPAKACVIFEKMQNNDNSQTEPEAAVDTNGLTTGELAQELNVFAWGDNGDNVWNGEEMPLFSNISGPASDVLNGKSYNLGVLPGGSTNYIGLYWCYGAITVGGHTLSCSGSAVTNVSQTDSLIGDIRFYVEQERNNPNFTCPTPQTTPTVDVVYNSIPDPLAGNYPSQAYEAQSASEFGGQILLTGTNRTDPKVTIMMSSWGCESGSWNLATCVTTPGSTFSHPITLNIYSVGSGNSVGSLITTKTQTFAIPYRPSKDPVNCPAGGWWNGTTCFNGLATPISFDLTGVTLPDNVIISLAYNTTHYGYAPVGEAATCYSEDGGCGYDSLNVALNTLGSVTYPLPDGAYMNSTWSGAYNDGGAGGLGTFRLDPTGWTAYQPIVKVEAN